MISPKKHITFLIRFLLLASLLLGGCGGSGGGNNNNDDDNTVNETFVANLANNPDDNADAIDVNNLEVNFNKDDDDDPDDVN